MQSLKSPWALLLAGVALILGSPLVAMAPFFTPPNGCPCPNFPNITYPLIWPGVVIGILGVVLVMVGGRRLKHVTHDSLRIWPLAYLAAALVLVGIVMITVPISGSNWEIWLYAPEGLYLFLLGLGTALFVFLTVWIDWKSALVLSIGLLVTGFLLWEHFFVGPA